MELILIITILSINIITLMIVIFKKPKQVDNNNDNTSLLTSIKQTEIGINNAFNHLATQHRDESDRTAKKVDDLTMKNENRIDAMSSQLSSNMRQIRQEVSELSQRNEQRIQTLTTQINTSMTNIRNDNERQLEKMRETVDEKLNSSLSTRLNESFSKIKLSLDTVGEGLGEMKSLAGGVGDLKRMLSNVKSRGVWGEVSLNNLLEQSMTSSQYTSQAQIKPNSTERVDFAVVLPGKDDQNILLPIDSKFPLEDYYRLVDATDHDDIDMAEKSKKALFKRIKDEAKKISEKYIYLPVTTDFAVMFLPLEGLYAEVVRNNDLIDTLQNQYKILVCGPTTIMALLNSLQMGFKTMYIEKRSSEIWNMLGVFRREFETFVKLLSKTQKKLDEAGSNIELATKSSRKISKQLGSVTTLDSVDNVSIDFDEDAT